jgi:hypothetical protein
MAISYKDVKHIVLIVLGTFNYLSAVLVIMMFGWFFSDENSNSKLPWAVHSYHIETLRMLKLIFGATIIISRNASKEFSIVLILVADAFSLYFHIVCTSTQTK